MKKTTPEEFQKKSHDWFRKMKVVRDILDKLNDLPKKDNKP